MKLSFTKSYNVTFNIESYWSEEGGMGFESFVNSVKTLEEAIQLLELANIRRDDREWIIVCNPEVATK